MLSKNQSEKINYKWWLDKKIISSIVIFSCISLMIFAFLDIPFLTSINKYTFEMLFGWYFPFVYFFLIFLFVKPFIKKNLSKIRWIKITWSNFVFLFFTIVLVSVTTGFYQSKTSWTKFGFVYFKAITWWWNTFTSSSSAWIPHLTNGGLIGALVYSFFANILTGVGALIISIFSIIITLYLFFGKAIISFIYKKNSKRKIANSYQKPKAISSQVFETKPIQISKQVKIQKDKETKEDLPFEDPF